MSLTVSVPPICEPFYIDEVTDHLKVDSSDDDTLITKLIVAARQYCELFQNRAYVTQTLLLKLDTFPIEFELPRPPLQSVSSIGYIDTSGDAQTLASSVYDEDIYTEPGRIAEAYNQVWPSIRGDINAVTVTYKAGYLAKCTADADTDIITVSDRIYSDDDTIIFSNSGGALFAGLSEKTIYYVVSADAENSTLQVAATKGGDAIDLTDTGTGINFIGELPETVRSAMLMLIGHWYEHRESISEINLIPVPMAVESLLWQDRVF